jgi:hypothetical protein
MAVVSDLSYAIGVDLGQQRDHTAIAIVESSEVVLDARNPATFEHLRERRTRLRHLHRVPLGVPYPDVVRVVKDIASAPALDGRCTVILDATGVGAPIVDLLKRAGMRARVVPVTITPGDRENSNGSAFRVPKRDLIAGLQVLFEDPKFEMPRTLAYAKPLIDELARMKATFSPAGHDRYNGDKDDLVLALSLAWWWTRKRTPGLWGTRPLL